MEDSIQVECTHLEQELVRVRFARSQIVSDHPAEFGGGGTGPAPGTMIQMALTSASALAGRQFAVQNKLDVNSVLARSSMSTVKEGLPEDLQSVALPHLTYAKQFWRGLEVRGMLSMVEAQALAAAMAGNRVAKTIRAGITLTERLTRAPGIIGRRGVAARASANRMFQGRPKLQAGDVSELPRSPEWGVTASATDPQTCLVKAAGSIWVVGSDPHGGRGPSPDELLLGGLAACTTIYVARNAVLHDIPVESVRVRVRAELPADPLEQITRVEKVAAVTGDLTSDEIAMLGDFAKFCAFGETLTRGAEILDSITISRDEAGEVPIAGLADLDRAAGTPTDPGFCQDGSCCLPAAPRGGRGDREPPTLKRPA